MEGGTKGEQLSRNIQSLTHAPSLPSCHTTSNSTQTPLLATHSIAATSPLQCFSTPPPAVLQVRVDVARSALERERGADLVAGLVELLGVEREAEADGGAGVELGAVRESRDAAVVDLDLHITHTRRQSRVLQPRGQDSWGGLTLAKLSGSSLYLLASSKPLAFCAWTSYPAFAPTSTLELTFW